MPGEMLREAYIRRGLHPKNLGRTVEDSAAITEPILPWTARVPIWPVRWA